MQVNFFFEKLLDIKNRIRPINCKTTLAFEGSWSIPSSILDDQIAQENEDVRHFQWNGMTQILERCVLGAATIFVAYPLLILTKLAFFISGD